MHYRFLILLFIILSGCITPPSSMQGGVGFGDSIIKKFSFTPSTVYSTEEVYLSMVLENSGDFLVKNIYIYVYNLGNDWGIIDIWGEKTYRVEDTPWRLDIDASFYYREKVTIGDSNVILDGDIYINDIENLLQGELPEVSVESVDIFIMRKDVSIMIEDLERFTSWAYRNNYERIADVDLERTFKTASKMPPVYVQYLYPPSFGDSNGERVEIYWIVKPPQDFPEGKEIRNTVKARVCYETTNKLSGSIRIMSRDEFITQGIGNINKKRLSSTSGPLELSMEVNDPLIFGDKEKVVNFVISVANTGRGVVTSEPCKEVLSLGNERNYEGINKFSILIEGLKCNIEDEEIYLPPNGKATIPVSCYVDTSQGSPVYDEFVDVKISYVYYEDVETSVVVKAI